MKVLVAVDGSDQALRMTRWVLEHLAEWRTVPEIHLLTVQPPVASGLVRRFVSQEAVEDYLREEGLKALDPARALLDTAGVSFHPHVGVGEVAHTIIEHAKQTDSQVIFMGTRGMGGARATLLGSTAKRVLEHSPVPVVVVP